MFSPSFSNLDCTQPFLRPLLLQPRSNSILVGGLCLISAMLMINRDRLSIYFKRFPLQPVARLYQHGKAPHYFVRWFDNEQAAIESAGMSNDTVCPICEQPNCVNVTLEEAKYESSKHLLSTELSLSRDTPLFVTVEMGNEVGCNSTLRRQISNNPTTINAQDVEPARKLVVRRNATGGYYDVSWSRSDDVTPLATTLYWCQSPKLSQLKVGCKE